MPSTRSAPSARAVAGAVGITLAMILSGCVSAGTSTAAPESTTSAVATPADAAVDSSGLFAGAADGMVLGAEIVTSSLGDDDIVVGNLDTFARRSGVVVEGELWLRAPGYADPSCSANRIDCGDYFDDLLLSFDAVTGELDHTIVVGATTSSGAESPLTSRLSVVNGVLWGVSLARTGETELVSQIFAVDTASGDFVVEPNVVSLPTAPSPGPRPPQIETLVVVDEQVIASVASPISSGGAVITAVIVDADTGELGASTLITQPADTDRGYPVSAVEAAIVRGDGIDYFFPERRVRYDPATGTATVLERQDIPRTASGETFLDLDDPDLVLLDDSFLETDRIDVAIPSFGDNELASIAVDGSLIAVASDTDGFALYDTDTMEIRKYTTSDESAPLLAGGRSIYLAPTGIWLVTDNRIYLIQTPDAAAQNLGPVPLLETS